MAVRQSWREGSDPRRHHGTSSLEKCHYNFLLPLFWLQLSRILLQIKNVSIHSVLHQIKSQYTGFLLLQAWTEIHQLICSPFVYFSIPSMHKPVFQNGVSSIPLDVLFFPLKCHNMTCPPTLLFPTDHLKRSNCNSSTKKIRLTSD